MAPYAPVAIRNVYDHLEDAYPSADRRSGILANKAGYHNSRNRLRAQGRRADHSILLPADLLGDGDAASAIDCKFGTADLRKVSQRLMAASLAKDPRVQGKIREWYGSYDGKKVVGYSLFRNRTATSDPSHLWHLHISGYRRYVNDVQVWLGIAEVCCGLPAGTLTTPKPPVVKPPAVKPVIDFSDLQAAVKSGAESASVKALQTALNGWRGSLALDVDGLWGPKTQDGVATFQAWKYGVTKGHPDADGIPGRESLGHLGFTVTD